MWKLCHAPEISILYNSFHLTKDLYSSILDISSKNYNKTFPVFNTTIPIQLYNNKLIILSTNGYYQTSLLFQIFGKWKKSNYSARYLFHTRFHIYLQFSNLILCHDGTNLLFPNKPLVYTDTNLNIFYTPDNILLQIKNQLYNCPSSFLVSNKSFCFLETMYWKNILFPALDLDSSFISPWIYKRKNDYYITDGRDFYHLPLSTRFDKCLGTDMITSWWNLDKSIFFMRFPDNKIKSFGKPHYCNIKFLSKNVAYYTRFLFWILKYGSIKDKSISYYLPKSLIIHNVIRYL